MVDETLSNDSSLPLSALERIDRVCQDFEAAWKAGTVPQIEPFLGDAVGQERVQLLKELLLLELDYHRRNAETPDITEYQSRFPQDGQLLAAVFANCAERASSPPRPGTRVRYFGDYELLEEIGSGGMGVVYMARQISLNRTVAVKMILRGHFVTDVEVRRFQAEAETLAELQYPNIVPIHEVGAILPTKATVFRALSRSLQPVRFTAAQPLFFRSTHSFPSSWPSGLADRGERGEFLSLTTRRSRQHDRCCQWIWGVFGLRASGDATKCLDGSSMDTSVGATEGPSG